MCMSSTRPAKPSSGSRSARRGGSTLDVEVTNVSLHGFGLLIGEAELTIVRLPSPHHLYWPDLDVDLAVDSLDHPDRYSCGLQAVRSFNATGGGGNGVVSGIPGQLPATNT